MNPITHFRQKRNERRELRETLKGLESRYRDALHESKREFERGLEPSRKAVLELNASAHTVVLYALQSGSIGHAHAEELLAAQPDWGSVGKLNLSECYVGGRWGAESAAVRLKRMGGHLAFLNVKADEFFKDESRTMRTALADIETYSFEAGKSPFARIASGVAGLAGSIGVIAAGVLSLTASVMAIGTAAIWISAYFVYNGIKANRVQRTAGDALHGLEANLRGHKASLDERGRDFTKNLSRMARAISNEAKWYLASEIYPRLNKLAEPECRAAAE